MLVQAQIPLRLNVEQILAAILLLSDEEKNILRKSTIEDLSINHDHYLYGLPKRGII